MPILELFTAKAAVGALEVSTKADAARRDNRRSDYTQWLSSSTLPQLRHRSSSTSADFLVSSLTGAASSRRLGPACAQFLAAILVLLTQACGPTKCASQADCGSNSVCVQTLGECRRSCQSANDCSGNTLCTGLGAGTSACLDPKEKPKIVTVSSDQSFANQNCNSNPSTCGDNAPLCIAPYATNTAITLNLCSFECPTGLDDECHTTVPDNCTGDCAQTFAHACCVPSENIYASGAAPIGAKTVGGVAVKTYCEPRLVCFDFPRRCNVGDPCPGVRTGACQASGDGGLCTSGTRGYFECCSRAGQCGNAQPLCETGTDNFGGYCTRECTGAVDANGHDDCYDPSTPFANATCGITVLEDAHVKSASGKEQCFVAVALPQAKAGEPRGFCHISQYPCLPASQAAGQCLVSSQDTDNTKTADLTDCNVTFERPRDDLSDNRYCEALHSCYNPTTDTCPQ